MNITNNEYVELQEQLLAQVEHQFNPREVTLIKEYNDLVSKLICKVPGNEVAMYNKEGLIIHIKPVSIDRLNAFWYDGLIATYKDYNLSATFDPYCTINIDEFSYVGYKALALAILEGYTDITLPKIQCDHSCKFQILSDIHKLSYIPTWYNYNDAIGDLIRIGDSDEL